MIWLWIFIGGYVVLMLLLILGSYIDHENPFEKKNMAYIFMPFKNLFIVIEWIFLFIAFLLMEFGDFCEDVGKSFKKHFC